MNLINSWAKGIVVAAIIGTIIEIILPNGKNKKYIKTIIGIYILFVIIYPVINKISGRNVNLDSITNTYNQTSMKLNKVNMDINGYVDKTYINNIKEKIKEEIESKGYEVKNLEIQIETKDENNYGKINSLETKIYITQKNNSNNINNIEKVEISNNNTITNIIEEEKITELRNYISETYSIDKTKIYINQ